MKQKLFVVGFENYKQKKYFWYAFAVSLKMKFFDLNKWKLTEIPSNLETLISRV